MNLLVLSPHELSAGGTAEVRDARARHVATVLRSRVGDRLRAGVLGGAMGDAEVIVCEDDRLVVRVEPTDPPPPPLPLTVALALPRPPVFRRLLTHLCAMGVKRIHVFHAERVEKSYWQSPTLTDESIRAALVQGLEQGRDTILPLVSLHRRFEAFVSEVLVREAAEHPVLWADPGGAQPCPSSLAGPTTVLVGPEGGFRSREVDRLDAAGLTRVHLGPRVLRTETAAIAVVARIADFTSTPSAHRVRVSAIEGSC